MSASPHLAEALYTRHPLADARLVLNATNLHAALFKFVKGSIPKHPEERAALAERADVSASTLYSWMMDHTASPRLLTMVKVLRALGYRLEIVAL